MGLRANTLIEGISWHRAARNEDPAEVSTTSPGHGPNNPYQENAVNEQHHTTAPVDPATMTPQAIRRETLALIERGDFARLSEVERHGIVAALVGSLSSSEVQAIGARVAKLSERRSA